MRNLILVVLLAVLSSGCSLLPRITFDRPGTTPQATSKSQKVIKCAGELKFSENGTVASCSKGFYSSDNDFKQAERTYTFAEKVGNFIAHLKGYLFWGGAISLVIIFMGGGWLISGLFNGIFFAGRTVLAGLKGTVGAISKFKSKIPKVTINGQEVYDPAYMKAVDDLFDELENAHSQDPNIIKLIGKLRTELKIEDNDSS